ncbi:MAG: hypothetical protein ACR5K2_05295 [Wolbachia sp.]
MRYGGDTTKIGKGEIEIIIENGIRNYIDFAGDSDILLIFYTSLGELEVRLCHDAQDTNLTMVEINS